jgi:PKD repeat protein
MPFSPGPANESAQAPLAYHLEIDYPALFTAAPVIDPASGDLSFTPAVQTWGTATVTATLQDDGGTARGGVDTGTPQIFQITVYPVNDTPLVDAGGDQSGAEGQVLTFSGTFTDPENPSSLHQPLSITGDPEAIVWDFGDGHSSNGSLTAQHAYGDNGAYTATLLVVDDEGGGDWDTLTVEVSNAATRLGAFPDLEAEAGQVLTVTGVLTDPGYLDTHAVVITWTDGQTTTLALGAEERQFSAPHTYGQAGEYAVTVKATDKDGSWDQKGFTINVATKKHLFYLPLVMRR